MTLRNRQAPHGENDDSASNETELIGIKQIADYLGYSQRTVWSWRREFKDFPVKQDGQSCIWYSSKERLDEFKSRHVDLFTVRKERLANYNNDERRSSIW